jgi:rhamnogalacturonan endolyase
VTISPAGKPDNVDHELYLHPRRHRHHPQKRRHPARDGDLNATHFHRVFDKTFRLPKRAQTKSVPVLVCLLGLLLTAGAVRANIPAGGTGTGPDITLTDNGSTVTLANGTVSILCTKSGATINQINYTYNNGGGTQTLNLLSGGNNGGQLYWENGGFGTGSFTETSSFNNGSYAQISLLLNSTTNGTLEVDFSMLRGSPGFYVTAIWSHRSQDGAIGMGETRDNIYAGSIFNWMSVDAARNRLMEVSGGSAIGVQGAPVEVSLWTNGIYAGQYEDKYKYSTDFGNQHVYGWSSVGTGGKNVGIWNIQASMEYHQNGPMKRDLMEHIGTTILNMHNSSHYGGGLNDCNWASGEVWTKVYGPYFIYCNNVTNTLTGTNQPAMALYGDAQAQALAEQGVDTNGQPTGAVGAWPYYWYTNANYAPASGRGTVSGQFVINDSGNPNASAAGLWVGVMQQPVTTTSTYDFQGWMKNYQFWVKTDTNGNFTIPNVIAGANYTLYAFGPGAEGTFQSQALSGGSTPNTKDIPSSPFSVTVTAGATNNLGTVTWTPTRVGATVFEIGYPSRTGQNKFRHGEDYWVGEIGPSPTAPSPIWSKWLEYPFDFPSGPNYIVGQSRWTTDWNFVQPCVVDSGGNYNNSSSTITFNLASTPSGSASFYMALCSDYQGAMEISVNGTQVSPANGYNPNYSGSGDECDSTIREGINADFSDNRITFAANLLHSGLNTINVYIRQIGGAYFANHAMYDYIRLELTGYVPPAPGSVVAYAGNNCNLVCWPVTPGATSYNILRSTTSGSGYGSITNGVIGPICGSGWNNATYLDTTAANGTTYYYEVQSVNPTGSSASSSASSGATPSSGISTSAPAAPTGLSVTSVGHQSVTLNWTASAGANYYSVFRSTLVNTGGGSSNLLGTIILNNTNTGTSYTDISPSDGSIYQYFVTAISAGGTSGNSASVVGVALPSPPAAAPASLTGSFVQTTNVTLNWSAVSGAVGYAIYRATSASGPFTYLQSVTETTYTDYGLNPATVYYYRVAAVNDAGISANATATVNGQQVAPASLSAFGANNQITLVWPAASGATSYAVKRGTSSGNETVTMVTGYALTSYTNTGLANGTTYYYVVTATGPGGTSANSPEASATPFATTSGIWTAPASGNWGAASNWSGGSIAYGSGSTADFSTIALPASLTVTLDSPRTISGLKFGDTSSSFNWTLSGTNILTMGTSPNINVVNQSATISTPIAGTTGLAKTGLGALTIGGATNVLAGGATVNAGSLTLDYTATGSPVTNLLPAANALALGGGTLQINGSGNATNTQTFASTTLNAGGSVISAAPVSGTTNPVVNLGAITANAGGLVEFNGPATTGSGGGNVASNALITTTASGNGAFVGGNGAEFYDANYATVGLYDYAATTGGSSPYTVVGGSQISGFYTSGSGSNSVTGGNLDMVANTTGWTAQPYLTSIRCNSSLGADQTIYIIYPGGSTLTLGDILVTPNVGSFNVIFNNGSLRPGGGSSSYPGPLVIWQNNIGGELILNPPVGNSKNGAAAYVQAGPGTVSITGTSSGYTNQSYLDGGVTMIAGNGSIGSATFGRAVNLNGGTLLGNATFTLDNAGFAVRPVTLAGNGGGLAATAGNTMTVDGVVSNAASAGPLTVGLPASSANGNVAGLVPGTGSGTANAAVYATGTVVLNNTNTFTGGTILQSGTLNINGSGAIGGANYGGLTFNGGTLQYAAGFTGNNGPADLTSIGTAGITLAPGGGTIDVNGNSITYTNSMGKAGPGGLALKSSLANGVLTLLGDNTYSGNTTVTNVTLLVNNLNGSATGSGNVTVQNNGILSGAGILAGSVTVGSGGTLSPGNPSGTLNIGNNLILAAGSTTLVAIQHSPLTNTAVNVSGTLTAGGTLVVSNSGVAAFSAGDTFNLLSAGGYAGGFNSITLPSLSPGLFWSTAWLPVNGAIGVVSSNSPAIGSAAMSGGNLVVQGTGGTPNWYYYVLSSTNVALPLSQWTVTATNQFDNAGNFDCHIPADPNVPQQFYFIMVQ